MFIFQVQARDISIAGHWLTIMFQEPAALAKAYQATMLCLSA